MKRVLSLSLCFPFLAGCATAERIVEKPVPYEVRIPIAVPCKVELIEVPRITPNQEALRLNDRDLVLLLAEEREVLKAYAQRAAAALQACQ